jgi:hypothetical protein
MINTAWLSFGSLKGLKIVYEYLDNDEGETWCEALEIWLGGQNMIDYLNDEVIQSLERQCIYIQQSTD